MDIVSYIWNIFGSNDTNTNFLNNTYDPLANVADFVIEINKQFGATNHPTFFEGSYAQV
jgi:hypothetical protein